MDEINQRSGSESLYPNETQGSKRNRICPLIYPLLAPPKEASNSVTWNYSKILHVELEMHDVAVLHHVVLAFLT